MEAVDVFLKENENFVMDENKEKFYVTFNRRGYLRKRMKWFFIGTLLHKLSSSASLHSGNVEKERVG
jgi:hypothetical protein